MIKRLVLLVCVLSFSIILAQIGIANSWDYRRYNQPKTVIEEDGYLVFEKKHKITKGEEIEIVFPVSGREFGYIKIKDINFNESVFNRKSGSLFCVLIGECHSINWWGNGYERSKKSFVRLSKNSKVIVGKKVKVIDWYQKDNNYILDAEIEGEKYKIHFEKALLYGEIVLKEKGDEKNIERNGKIID